MSIRRRQIRDALNKILQKELQKGRYPSMRTLSKRMAEYFDEHVPGLPIFKPRHAPRRGVSNPQEYNEMLDEISDDLNMVFSETINQSKRLLNNFDHNEVERNKIYNKLQQLEDKVDNLLLLTENTEGYLDSVYDDFIDYSKINLEKTTANIDLNSKEVTLKEIKSGGRKYPLEGKAYTIKAVTPNTTIETISEFSNALDDYLNTAWLCKVKGPKDKPVTIEVIIELTNLENDPNNKFADEIMISCIEFTDHSPRPTTAVALWSNDNINYFPVDRNKEPITIKNSGKWLCDETPMQYIKLRLTKTEPDEKTEDNLGVYRFGAKSIDVKKLGFIDQGLFVSKPHKIEHIDSGNPVNQIALDVTEDKPKFTDIKYYIKLPDQISNVRYPISHIADPNPEFNKVLNLNNLARQEIPAETMNGQHYSTNNGIDFYKLKTLDYIPTRGSTQLYRGAEMWKKEKYITEEFSTTDPNHKPTLIDWVNLPADVKSKDVKSSYVNMTSTLPLENDPHLMTKFTTYILSKDVQVIKNINLSHQDIIPSILINGREININNSDTYTLRLSEGWNKLEILTYTPDDGNTEFDLGFLPADYGTLRAERLPLTEVSLYDLQNNVLMNDNSKFAIDGDSIIVNFNPNGIKFEITYSYSISTTDIKEVILEAELSREKENTTLTPILKNYHIKIS